jgi:Lytic transglycolase
MSALPRKRTLIAGFCTFSLCQKQTFRRNSLGVDNVSKRKLLFHVTNNPLLQFFTANGENAIASDMTAAHRSLPFGTRVRVTNGINGISVVVRINDRGPFIAGRVIDLKPAGALALGFSGLVPVTLALVAD